ncbi:unnamed protein product [Fraxinus pennsylvanica]|uniref:DUF7804 domain-containing protein n=1 Tax=Fraxinus pennsylvanica TaxID=56036 RepID=A0AAD2ADM4_9LAMI|nr:unnamed protein product [Fraxinus pennsylvanica]
MASLRGNCSFSLQYAEERSSNLLHRHKLAKNKSFFNPNRIRRIAISANCTDTNRINLSSKPSLFHHIVDSDQLKSNSYIQHNKRTPDEEAEVISEELDRWVKDSAVEIVSNLDEAPFLVHVYGDNGNRSNRATGIKLVREKAIAEDWPFIQKRWEGGSPTPNGIMLVEELSNQEPEPEQKLGKEMLEIKDQSPSSTKAWGILIQGKRRNCTACYLLKTSQVQSVAGFCTHFCLVRVDCFVEHADILLKKMWLQCP